MTKPPWQIYDFKDIADKKYHASPMTKAQFLASLCYQGSLDAANQSASSIPVDVGLFRPGHHTTHEASYMTFIFDRIPVSMVTFGLHMTHPFYNTTQRSGRFCSAMFNEPYEEFVRNFLDTFGPFDSSTQDEILQWVADGVDIYHENIDDLTSLARERIKAERPNATESYIDTNAPKFAQEQLRNVISTIFPTALSYTVDLIAAVSMREAAWNRPLQLFTQQMFDLYCKKNSVDGDLAYLEEQIYSDVDFELEYELHDSASAVFKPDVHVNNSTFPDGLLEELILDPDAKRLSHPLDLLHFSPKFSKYYAYSVESTLQLSVATFGQEQRHRTIHRSAPTVLSSFYVPPLLAFRPKVVDNCVRHYQRWIDLVAKTSFDEMLFFIPYGAQVRYTRSASGPALYHELQKRRCWCAQEEISCVGEQMNQQLTSDMETDGFNAVCQSSPLKCGEGRRYCGREIRNATPLKRRTV